MPVDADSNADQDHIFRWTLGLTHVFGQEPTVELENDDDDDVLPLRNDQFGVPNCPLVVSHNFGNLPIYRYAMLLLNTVGFP